MQCTFVIYILFTYAVIFLNWIYGPKEKLRSICPPRPLVTVPAVNFCMYFKPFSCKNWLLKSNLRNGKETGSVVW